MNYTNDQYLGLNKLLRWYRKYSHQIIEISGVVGTGVWELIQEFFTHINLEYKEIMYLTYNQKQMLDLAYKKYHAYYIDGVVYKYNRVVDFNSLYVINPNSKKLECEWNKEVRKKIDPKYKMMVVFDSSLMNYQTLKDLCTFGLPIILIKDPMLLPSKDTYTYIRDANIELTDLIPSIVKQPINYFAHKVLNNMKLDYGNYDNVTIIPKKQMNLYNLKSADMTITLGEDVRNAVNSIYRSNILKCKDITNVIGERVIMMNTLYNHKLVNKDEKNIKLYLTKGVVGNLSKINKHAINTKWVPCEFKLDCYYDTFTELVINRHYLNKINVNSSQMIPDEEIDCEYAYALTPALARLNYWDKVTLILDGEHDETLRPQLIYSAITRARNGITIIY